MAYRRWQGPDRPVSNGSEVERLTLASDVDAPSQARRAISELAGHTDDDVIERATLLITEVVTNSVRHAAGDTVRVKIWPSHGTIAVVVTDDGPGFAPATRTGTVADGDGEGGLGLPLLDTLAEAWGSGSDDQAEAWVWFEVAPRIIARPAELAPAEPEHGGAPDVRVLVDSVKAHALVALDSDGLVTNWGRVAEDLTGYPPEEFLGRALSDLYSPATPGAFGRDRASAWEDGWHQAERWIQCKDGSRLCADVALAPMVSRTGEPCGLSALISDITARKEADAGRERLIAQLRELAMTDELTGLPNRRRWVDELNRDLARSRRYSLPLAIAMVDLNGFKSFNDSEGHPAGDDLLRRVAREWSEALRTTDMLARYGGDEFAVSLPDCAPDLACAVIGRMLAATPGDVAAAAGIATSNGAEPPEQLLARADRALYDAKRRGEAFVVDDAAG